MAMFNKKRSKRLVLFVLVMLGWLQIYGPFLPRFSEMIASPKSSELDRRDLSYQVVSMLPVGTNSTVLSSIPNVKIPTKLQRAMEDNSPNRSIVFVHVGKAGGRSLLENVAARCQTLYPDEDNLPSRSSTLQGRKRSKCFAKFPFRKNRLANQTRHYFHPHVVIPTDEQFEQATSFLVSIRNPLHRIHSSYRYTHPANCKRFMTNGEPSSENFGCFAFDTGRMEPGHPYHFIWSHCFPSPQMEDFAQAILPPWNNKTNQHFITKNFSASEQLACRERARELVQGIDLELSAPHMRYNYNYYAEATIMKYPQKEVFAVRTEQEHSDMVRLDVAMGGRGDFRHPHEHYSHGSEYYEPSVLSAEAYQKLCCVLEDEINVYFQIFERSLNLDEVDLLEANQILRKQCGLESTQSWSSWRESCKEKLAQPMEQNKER